MSHPAFLIPTPLHRLPRPGSISGSQLHTRFDSRTSHRPIPLHNPVRCTLSRPKLRGTSSNPYQIAILPGDLDGPPVTSLAVRVLSALAEFIDLHFQFTYGDYGGAALENGAKSLVPEETLRICRSADAVLRGYAGRNRVEGVETARLLREGLGLCVQLRPVVVYDWLMGLVGMRKEVVEGTDIILVREVGGGALRGGADGKESSTKSEGEAEAVSVGKTEIRYTKEEIRRVVEVAVKTAEQRSGRIVNIDKADVMEVSKFWRAVVDDTVRDVAPNMEGIQLTHMYVDDFVRDVILNPGKFDTILTSNLFGDIIAEVIAALAGSERIAPSAWLSPDGVSIYGPADVYNVEAYPEGQKLDDKQRVPNPIATIRSASMLLRYSLEEPAAANLIQNALSKAMTTMMPRVPRDDGNGATRNLLIVDPNEFEEALLREFRFIRQYEQVCDPAECGE